ncbi:protein EMSY-LIKE 2 isoform X2 [Capsella rubella]|uniref:protein EMSY-LIKE 2 isoform X2 n=1 Tax=Capsella rubella TaxID=81985 RepID=UPI000CD55F57|nr:protein EMSY-LIKE 2 isoform X2 [Capsella rubella]
MADQKDQGTNPPAEKPGFLPLKNGAMAEKSLAGYNRAPESNSKPCLSDEKVTKETLKVLQKKAFYSVLQAFGLETSTMSNVTAKKNEIIQKLMNEWAISDETRISFADEIQKNLLTLQQREDASVSGEKEMRIVPETSLTKPVAATPTSTLVPKSKNSWGSVNPESLIGKWVGVRLPDEAKFETYIIKEYDATQDMHRLIEADSNAMEVDGSYSWFDLREISSQDIMWEGGIKPNFDTPKQTSATARRALF